MNTIDQLSQKSATRSPLEEQHRLAEDNHKAAQQVVEDYRRSLERRHGIPIVVRRVATISEGRARATPAWWQQPPRDHHLIELESSLPKLAKPHAIAHELTHLDLAGRPMQVGNLLCHVMHEDRFDAEIECLKPSSRKLYRQSVKGDAEKRLRRIDREIATRVSSRLLNASVDMVVETMIKRQMPLLAASQFVGARLGMDELLNEGEWVRLQRTIRRRFYRALRALDGAYSLFLDELFDNTTDYFAKHRNTEFAKLAKSLVRRFNSLFPKLRGGGEYDIVDSFADLLGLRDIYTWIGVPLLPVEGNAATATRSLRLRKTGFSEAG